MWIADQWNDYEVLDTSCGEKLERWGDYYLVRPDPQVLWQTPKKLKQWKKPNGHYHRSSRGGGQWEFFDLPKTWDIRYRELTFHLQPFSFKHTGVFPEQAVNWDWFSDKDQKGRAACKGAEPVCLHRRRHISGSRSRGIRDSRGCLQRHGELGKRECPGLRPERQTDPLAGGRLCEICREGDPPGGTTTMGSSWTLRPTAGDQKERSGRLRKRFFRLFSSVQRFCRKTPYFF